MSQCSAEAETRRQLVAERLKTSVRNYPSNGTRMYSRSRKRATSLQAGRGTGSGWEVQEFRMKGCVAIAHGEHARGNDTRCARIVRVSFRVVRV